MTVVWRNVLWMCGIGVVRMCGTRHCGYGMSRDALEGGEVLPPPPPSMGPSRCPATVPLTASASFNGICKQPPPTAFATSSNGI